MAKDSLEGRDVRQLDQHVSAALARGVKYNMKILIRGQVAQHACEASRVRPSCAEPAPACAVSMCRWGRASDAEVRPHRVCVCVCVCVCVYLCVCARASVLPRPAQRKTGKTQLLRRMQGLEFVADYTPTPEISTAHLIWTCPATDEKVIIYTYIRIRLVLL
jgi:hypothetical protein